MYHQRARNLLMKKKFLTELGNFCLLGEEIFIYKLYTKNYMVHIEATKALELTCIWSHTATAYLGKSLALFHTTFKIFLIFNFIHIYDHFN